MAIEIERKFLLKSGDWRPLVTGELRLRQAYLAQDGTLSNRVRITDGKTAALTMKSRKAGMRRFEFEYAIPLADAEALITLRHGAVIEKVRHHVPWQGLLWEIDEFGGENAGLVIAEIELTDEKQRFETPPWVGDEITGDERYYNSSLAKRPYCTWPRPVDLRARSA